MKRYLILENGKVFEGEGFGADGEVTAEIVFTTAMTGFFETLTDKSYTGQAVVQTFPLIGNYGVIPEDAEGDRVSRSVAFFENQADATHLWEAARRIAERGNCDLVDVTFIDNDRAWDLRTLYGMVKVSDVAISAVLRPRKQPPGRVDP